MSSTIQFSSVVKHYRRNLVIDGVNLSIQKGEFLALIGSNGAGKSTLMRLAAGIEGFDSGEILINGISIDKYLEAPHVRIGYLSESAIFNLPMSMRDYFGLQKKLTPSWDGQKAEQLARTFQLNLSKTWAQVSRGQKIQFSFILLLCSRPEILILDEVTAVLDASARRLVVEEIRAFTHAGGTAVVSTNIVSELQAFVDRIAVIDAGKILIDRTSGEIGRDFIKYRSESHGDLTRLISLGAQPIGENSDGSVTYILPKTGAASAGDLSEDRREVTAEEVFVYHTRRSA